MCCGKLKDAGTSAIAVSITYPGASGLLRGAVALELSDLLRPAPMSTDRFGGFWKTFSQEKKWAVTATSVSTPQEFVTRARDVLGIYHVQMINSENICAGKLASPASQDKSVHLFFVLFLFVVVLTLRLCGLVGCSTICLLHGRLKGAVGNSAKSLELTVRTQSAEYSALAQTLINAVFSQ
jgi:hypothetical protein